MAVNSQLYTPALLAEIIGVSARVIRRWHRAGLLPAATEVLQLPHFDFSQLAAARRLARWMQQGATVQSIQQQLQMLRDRAQQQLGTKEDFFGNLSAEHLTLEHLPISADGKRLVLRSGDHFLEANGQLRFGFEEPDLNESGTAAASVVPFQSSPGLARSDHTTLSGTPSASVSAGSMTLQQMLDEAWAAEDADDLGGAIDWTRAALAGYGASAELCFQLAELLYRSGDITAARERYFMALELDANLVEARANLGCVLAELGQAELAVAAFEGTLEQYADYADVHFHLARALEDLGQTNRAIEHWRQFLQLAPASPWADEAAERLGQLAPLNF
jgi:tetratricopeptide (TPR) repeat protein